VTPAVRIAVLVAVALALAWYWRPRHPVAPGVWILLGCYAGLGAVVLWFGLRGQAAPESAAFLIWKPTLLYGIVAAVLVIAPLRGWGHPAKAVIGAYFVFSDREWHWINVALAVLCVTLGILNVVAAYGYTPDVWNGLRFSCMMNLLALLMLRMAFVWMDLLVRIGAHLFGRAHSLLPRSTD
jgi:intracellular septation protein